MNWIRFDKQWPPKIKDTNLYLYHELLVSNNKKARSLVTSAPTKELRGFDENVKHYGYTHWCTFGEIPLPKD